MSSARTGLTIVGKLAGYAIAGPVGAIIGPAIGGEIGGADLMGDCDCASEPAKLPQHTLNSSRAEMPANPK